jgi:hypothetical protein
VFLLGGMKRQTRHRNCILSHGDVVVWGGPARLRFHGVQPLVARPSPADRRMPDQSDVPQGGLSDASAIEACPLPAPQSHARTAAGWAA